MCYDFLREKVKMPSFTEVNEVNIFNILRVNQKSQDQIINDRNKKVLLRHLFEKISNQHQEILYYRLNLNLSFKEIAKKKNMSINTCLSQYAYAVKAIKKVADKYSLTKELDY